ncbi:MAG: hypothetical protein COA99_14055, partial [Moraxellaceae bacterium]
RIIRIFIYRKEGNAYISALQCGAGRDAYLSLELSETEIDEIEFYALEPMKRGLSKGVDLDKLREAVFRGIVGASETTGKKHNVKRVGYIPNDSEHYDLHSRIAYNILERIHSGGEFRENEPDTA